MTWAGDWNTRGVIIEPTMQYLPTFGKLAAVFLLLCVASGPFGTLSYGQIYVNEFRPGPSAPRGFKPGVNVDASGLNLEDSFFGGVDLSGASFRGSNLRNAHFCQIDSRRGPKINDPPASFEGADLRGAAWDGYDYRWLQTCDFHDARIEGMMRGHYFRFERQFLSPEQIRSTKSFKLKSLSGFFLLGGSLRGEERPEDPENWTKIGEAGFNKKVVLDLEGFDLSNTAFRTGDFTGSKFTDAYIRGATFSAARIQYDQIASTLSWRGRTLDNSFLPTPLAITLKYIDCSGWDFSRRNLRGSKFEWVDLTGANFHRANLREVKFFKCEFGGADLSESDLRNATIVLAGPDRAASIADSDVRGAELLAVSQDQLSSTASYKRGDLSGIKFRMDLEGMDLSCQVLVDCVFSSSNLKNTDFTDAVISGCTFREFSPEHVPSVDQIKSTWNYKHDRMEGIVLPEEVAEALGREEENASHASEEVKQE